MTSHSAILGGSNAARLLACPASYQEQLRNPIQDVELTFAAEGTALHMAIANIVESRVVPEQLLGAEFYGHVMTEEHVQVLRKALDSLHALMNEHGNRKQFRIVGIEETLPMPGILGSFGTLDLCMADKRTVLLVDWKFGSGVPVYALHVDEQGGYLNPQLAFGAVTARAAHRRRFRGKKIVCAIIQPRMDVGCDSATTDDGELDDFHSAFMHAFSEALGRNAHRERGDHCRFATCKATCPFWTGPAFDLADIDPTAAALQQSVAADPTAYGAFLSKSLRLADYAEAWAAEIRRQGHVFLESGGVVPGFKLVPKRATRKWVNDGQNAHSYLDAIEIPDADRYTAPELKSVAQMEKLLKAHGLKGVPDDLYEAVSTGTTIAEENDSRPSVDRATVAEEVKKALTAL